MLTDLLLAGLAGKPHGAPKPTRRQPLSPLSSKADFGWPGGGGVFAVTVVSPVKTVGERSQIVVVRTSTALLLWFRCRLSFSLRQHLSAVLQLLPSRKTVPHLAVLLLPQVTMGSVEENVKVHARSQDGPGIPPPSPTPQRLASIRAEDWPTRYLSS